MRIRLVGHFQLVPSGYGDVALGFATVLRAAGHEVQTAILNGGGRVTGPLPDINVVVSVPELFEISKMSGVPNVGYTMCEASKIGRGEVMACNGMDQIMVPSSYCAQALRSSGVKVPVHVVPIGVRVAPLPLTQREGGYQFLSIFQWTSRKNPSALLKAYLSEFTEEEPVTLVIKTWPYLGRQGCIRPEHEVETLCSQFPKAARVKLVQATLLELELRDLYAASDCYVSTHRGEGWGLPLFDAMGYGLPAIATRYGGSLEFMSETNSYLANCSVVPAVASESGLLERYEGAEWAEVQQQDLQRLMRYVYQHREAAKGVGIGGSTDVHERFSSVRSTEAFLDAILQRRAA